MQRYLKHSTVLHIAHDPTGDITTVTFSGRLPIELVLFSGGGWGPSHAAWRLRETREVLHIDIVPEV